MSSQPYLVGITGGIGSGKSIVCKVFNQLGIPVYDADKSAKRLMTENADLIDEIKHNFGEESYLSNGLINRQYLAEKVFNDETALQQLNALVHPKVGTDFKAWVAVQKDAPYLIKEAALMIESGSYKSLDKLIVVKASLKTKIRRVLLRDPFRSREEVNAIIDKQLSDTVFNDYADFTINNNEENLILPSIIKMHEKLKALASQRG